MSVLGCEGEPPEPSGRLRRPSGLAYVERSDTRADLFLADSEAQGIRILQYRRESNGSVSSTFVPAPVVFLPLVLSAYGFPNRLAISRDVALEGGRSTLFALAPATARLYVINVAELPFFGRSLGTNDNVTLGQVDLIDATGGGGVPIDLATLGFSGTTLEDGRDFVAILVDGLGRTASRLVVLKIGRAGATALLEERPPSVTQGLDELGDAVPDYGDVSRVATATVADGPRAMLVRIGGASRDRGVVLLTSSSGRFITEVEFDLTRSEVLVASRSLDAGGETGDLVDLGARGVLALRTDRASAVLFESIGDRFVRSSATMPSPYSRALEGLGADALDPLDPVDPVDPSDLADAAGRLDLGPDDSRASLPRAGALGRIDHLNQTSTGPELLKENKFSGPPYEVVFLVRHDGRAQFLGGDPLRLVTTQEARISRVNRLSEASVRVPECDGTLALCGVETSVACAEGVLRVPRERAQVVRVSLRGSLHRSGSGRLAPENRSGVFALTDEQLVSFRREDRIAVGDHVLVQGVFACTEPPLPFIETGTVAEVSSDTSLVVHFGGALAESPEGCRDTPVGGVVYDVHPSRDEVVVSAFSDLHQRLAPNHRVALELFEGGPDTVARVDAEVRLTLEIPYGAACRLADRRECASDADCGPGRRCQASSEGCASVCTEDCVQGAGPDCRPRLSGRSCPGVEVSASATIPHEVDLSANLPTALAAPEAVVFSPLLEGWLSTFPANRALLELRPLSREEAETQKVQSIPFARTLQR